MGIVKEIYDDVVDFVEDTARKIKWALGDSEHKKGPSVELTYNRRNEWDAKKRKYEDQQQRLESERDEYAVDAYRLEAVTRQRNSLIKQIADEEARLEELQRSQAMLEAEKKNAELAKEGYEARRAWRRTAEQMVDRVVEASPKLEKLVERMTDEYNDRLDQRFEDSQKGLKSHRDSLIAAKRANTKETTQLKEQVTLLQEIVRSLDELKRERKDNEQ